LRAFPGLLLLAQEALQPVLADEFQVGLARRGVRQLLVQFAQADHDVHHGEIEAGIFFAQGAVFHPLLFCALDQGANLASLENHVRFAAVANNIAFLDGLLELPGHLLPLRLDSCLPSLFRQPINIARSAIEPAVAVEFYFVHLFPLSLLAQSNKVKHRPQFSPAPEPLIRNTGGRKNYLQKSAI